MHLHINRVALLMLGVLVAGISARFTDAQPSNSLDEQQHSQGRSASGVLGDLRYVYQMYKDCSGSEVSSCLKLKLLTTMDRVSRSVQVNVLDGVTLVKDESSQQSDEAPKSQQEIEAELPRSLEDKEDALNSMIVDKAVNFFQTHTLKVKLPNVVEEMQRSLSDEGRQKQEKKKRNSETVNKKSD